MKKILMICAVILGFAFTASAQDSQKAEFKFNEEKHDFGKIPQGTPVTTVFEFTNVGKEPLILTEVRPTCGCTIADYTKTPVKSGDKGTIKITYNAAAAAPFNKTIVVKSNAVTPEKYLNIVGEVVVAKPASK
jgi:ABC-type amino acid transport substrate-binding protein